MKFDRFLELLKIYSECPNCGCSTVGGGTGTVEADSGAGYFKRTCHCGWSVEVNETNCSATPNSSK